MEIKPTGAGGIPVRPADKPGDRGKLPAFSGAVPDAAASQTPAPGLEALRTASKADLQTPEGADALVHRCLNELVDAASQQLNRPVSEQDRQYLSDFLAGDPVMRGKLRGYLEQVLK